MLVEEKEELATVSVLACLEVIFYTLYYIGNGDSWQCMSKWKNYGKLLILKKKEEKKACDLLFMKRFCVFVYPTVLTL